MAKTKTKITKTRPTDKRLAPNAKRVTKKFTKAERAERDRVATLAEEEFSPRPVSAAKIALAKLRTARQLADISLTELSRRTGMAKPSLSRLENHCENVTLAVLEKYAAGVGCSIEVSINRATPVKARTIKARQMKKAVKEATPVKKTKRVAKR